MSSDTPPPSSFDGDADFYEESRLKKLARRLKEEPLVPLGMLLTCGALFGATRAMRTNVRSSPHLRQLRPPWTAEKTDGLDVQDHQRANIMFRRRIYAQFFTIAAIVAGSSYWSQDRAKRAEFEKMEKERERVERRERWLAELEARDREDREIRERARTSRDVRLKGQSVAEKRKPDVLGELMAQGSGGEGEKKTGGGGSGWGSLWSKKE